MQELLMAGTMRNMGGDGGKKSTWSMSKMQRNMKCHEVICRVLDGDGTYEAVGGGMMCFSAGGAQGPLVRDIQICRCGDRSGREWNLQINSDVELVSDGGAPADAKALFEKALTEVRGTDIMPFKCVRDECRRPCKNRKCARCKNVVYCSAECQKKHWKEGHKKVCKPAS
jgi:hypothetical protein